MNSSQNLMMPTASQLLQKTTTPETDGSKRGLASSAVSWESQISVLGDQLSQGSKLPGISGQSLVSSLVADQGSKPAVATGESWNFPSVPGQNSKPLSFINEGSRPSSAVSQVSRPSSVMNQVSRPPSVVSQGSRPPSAESQVSRPPSVMSQVSRPPSVTSQGPRPSSAVSQGSRPASDADQASTLPATPNKGSQPPCAQSSTSSTLSVGEGLGARSPSDMSDGSREPSALRTRSEPASANSNDRSADHDVPASGPSQKHILKERLDSPESRSNVEVASNVLCTKDIPQRAASVSSLSDGCTSPVHSIDGPEVKSQMELDSSRCNSMSGLGLGLSQRSAGRPKSSGGQRGMQTMTFEGQNGSDLKAPFGSAAEVLRGKKDAVTVGTTDDDLDLDLESEEAVDMITSNQTDPSGTLEGGSLHSVDVGRRPNVPVF